MHLTFLFITSTTVEIILYYLTLVPFFPSLSSTTVEIILYYLTICLILTLTTIYNSRNYSILLNISRPSPDGLSTTVEIILYYLTLTHALLCANLQQ